MSITEWKVVIVAIFVASFVLARKGNVLGVALALFGCGIALTVLP